MKQALFTSTVLFAALASSAAFAAGPRDVSQPGDQRDDRVDQMSQHQREMRSQGLDAVLNGKATGPKKVREVAKGQYVELAREGEDPIWTVLGDFPDLGHNEIPEPDRALDNSTVWQPDFGRDYYMDILFAEGDGANSLRDFYIKQSSGRYAVYGDVTEWVTVPGEAAGYDDDISGPAVWQFLIDTTRGWYDAQIAAGKTPAEIDAYLAQFDVWDRYDWDGDGNFNEPDGYIDHAQFVHAGMGNEAGGGVLGDSAIWSHSWYAYSNYAGYVGPSPDFLIGGIQIGDSSYWVGKYTIQPENGGVGVFAHEYAHDLGVPDLYDYTPGFENSTGFWTLMSSGSWLGTTEDIGSKPNDLGAWEKFLLGWLNYEVAFAGDKSEHKLGPAETNTKQAQGLFVVLPQKEVVEEIGAPYEGDHMYYSGSGNNLDTFMYRYFDLQPGTQLTAAVNGDIEYGWDYAYLLVTTDGVNWQPVETNFSTTDDPNGLNLGYGITGSTGGNWLTLTADLSAYTGGVYIAFRYVTDEAVVGQGFMVDNIQVGAEVDGAEGPGYWDLVGFNVSTGVETALYDNYYLAEFRQYRGYDEGMQYCYNFGYTNGPDWVEHFPYQDGLLVSYWDQSFADNDVAYNCYYGRCGGMLLPIDAHPDVLYRHDGGMWRNRVQSFDATFGLEPTDAITLHYGGEPNNFQSLPAEPVFDDTISHYRPENPTGSVNHPNTGTQIRVKSVSALNSFMQVEVRPAL